MQTTNDIIVSTPVTDTTEIVFEPITSEYSWGRYGDFKVIIHMQSGYINASYLCSLATADTGTKTKVNDWTRNNQTIALLKAASDHIGIPIRELTKYHAVANNVRGTYMHPILIPYVASWASPVFAIKVADVINAWLARPIMDLCRAHEERIRALLAERDERTEQDDEHEDVESSISVPCDDEYPSDHVRDGYVYFIIADTHPVDSGVKVGHAIDPLKRLKQLQTGSMATLRVYKQVYSVNRIELEASLHKRLDDRRVRGEWFRLTLAEVDDLVSELEHRPAHTE